MGATNGYQSQGCLLLLSLKIFSFSIWPTRKQGLRYIESYD